MMRTLTPTPANYLSSMKVNQTTQQIAQVLGHIRDAITILDSLRDELPRGVDRDARSLRMRLGHSLSAAIGLALEWETYLELDKLFSPITAQIQANHQPKP